MTHLLLLHGNGGAHTRFELLLPELAKRRPDLIPVLPQLPGFSGRPYEGEVRWEPFIQALGEAVMAHPQARWVFYGHGIGGSVLLEWAAQGYPLPNGSYAQPEQVILHAPVGASLAQRWFPTLMKPPIFRRFIHWLIYQPWLQKRWEQRLFLFPERIPEYLKQQFFADYRECAAFPVFFDLIVPAWYQRTQAQLAGGNFLFVWGEKERVIASKYLALWQADFLESDFEVIPAWDHFPMLEQVEEFAAYLAEKVV